jgi:membrane protease YdiL (CAAX protease family)
MLSLILYLNYKHGLEIHYIAASINTGTGFCLYYLLYALPFAAAFILQRLFYTDADYYRSYWFWIILLLAPAIFAFRVNFNFHQQWVQRQWPGPGYVYYAYCINWVVRVMVVMLLLLLLWWIKDRKTQPFYGIKKTSVLKPYLLMLLLMVPLIVLAATQVGFQAMYPRAKLIEATGVEALQHWKYYLFFELCYGFDFISIEFFFRGFLILSLWHICGRHCIIPAACFYCCIHLGKPLGEAISSFFGGILLGVVTYNTKSIWGGLLVHLGIAWLMEAAGWLARLPLL